MANAPEAATAEPRHSEEAERLAAGAVDSLPLGALAAKLAAAEREGRPLRVKLGIDPTAPDIHLGHAVVLRKLRDFQDAGHRVVLIVGDFTARVGDPSGRSTLRPILSEDEIDRNAETFQAQASRILDVSPELLEVRRNGEWLDMGMVELLGLARTTTAAQLLERDDFAKRLAARQPVSVLELLYPLLQGYDSVAVRADVELGGTDQKFNLLLGRDIQRAYGVPEQAILTMPILAGTDGTRKMSKSLGNQIGVTDPPEEMYGKLLSIPDEAIEQYRALLLRPGGAGAAPNGSARDSKHALAREVVAWLYGPEEAERAAAHFERVVVRGEAPEEVPEALLEAGEESVHVPALIEREFGMSRSQARRLIDQGAVSVGDTALAAGEHDVPVERLDGALLRVGKRRFRRLRTR
ncbi:MAG TPA: tyrosine--tRNA ligase [Solirubrobacteraceae bacterium]|jgi:tyrosyl-tRNA synthetase|nr:tyrosine--tRNA ligase [Solirubrobacteraceae bacterium]